MLGQALKGNRDRVILATKVGYTPDPSGHRDAKSLMDQFDGSLRRLGTDHVDIIQIHEADFLKWWADASLDEVTRMSHNGELIDMEKSYDFLNAPFLDFLRLAKKSGKTRFVGLTGKNARRLERILNAVDGIDTIMLAHDYNVILRNGEKFLFPLVADRNMGLLLGAVLMKGWLANSMEAEWQTRRPDWMTPEFAKAYSGFIKIQQQCGLPLVELSLRWLLGKQKNCSIVVGCANPDEVVQNAEIIDRGPLPKELQGQIDRIGIIHPLIYQGRTEL